MVTTGALRRAKLQSNRHHQQTSRMPFRSSNQQCRSTKGKKLYNIAQVKRKRATETIFFCTGIDSHDGSNYINFGVAQLKEFRRGGKG